MNKKIYVLQIILASVIIFICFGVQFFGFAQRALSFADGCAAMILGECIYVLVHNKHHDHLL